MYIYLQSKVSAEEYTLSRRNSPKGKGLKEDTFHSFEYKFGWLQG